MAKANCWEVMKCGREPGGQRTEELGPCPAASDSSVDGMNSGKNAGRICWAVAGTFCGNGTQGEYAQKMDNCILCDFYHQVAREESEFQVYPQAMPRQNCWQFLKCGREPGGAKADELGVCPAATASEVDGLNNGTNGGRICWAIAGTLCGGKTQGEFASKMVNCIECAFYKTVFNEESDFLVYPAATQKAAQKH